MLELKKKATDKFREIDGNGSGFLANDELDKLVTYINGVCFDFFNARKALLEKYDKDHDGKINLEEFLCIMDDISHADSDVVQTSIGPRLVVGRSMFVWWLLVVLVVVVSLLVTVCGLLFPGDLFVCRHPLSSHSLITPIITPILPTLSTHPLITFSHHLLLPPLSTHPITLLPLSYRILSNNATVRKVKTHRTTTTDNSASSTPRGGLEASLKVVTAQHTPSPHPPSYAPTLLPTS